MPKLETEVACTNRPIFCPISVNEKIGVLEITWNHDGTTDIIFNLPAITENCDIQLFADGNEVPIFCNSAIKNQYGWVYLHQSRSLKAKQIKLLVK